MAAKRPPLKQMVSTNSTQVHEDDGKLHREKDKMNGVSNQPYVKEYIKVLLKCEKTYLASPKNFRTNSKSRNVVVDWLIHVHDRYMLPQTVLHKTISLMDDYSSKKHVKNSSLQLVGIACMSLTIKNAGSPIESSTLVDMCGSYFTKDDLHEMEIDVLLMAQFDLNRPVCPQFLSVLDEHYEFPHHISSLSKFFLDLWLFHFDFVKYRTSVVASSAIVLALHATDNASDIPKWTRLLAELFKFSRNDMDKTVVALYKTVNQYEREKHPSIQEKYSSENFKTVHKKFTSLEELNGFRDLNIPGNSR